MTRLLLILALLLIGCTPEPSRPPHSRMTVTNRGAKYEMFFCPYFMRLFAGTEKELVEKDMP